MKNEGVDDIKQFSQVSSQPRAVPPRLSCDKVHRARKERESSPLMSTTVNMAPFATLYALGKENV